MVKITKRLVDAAEAREKDYVIWMMNCLVSDSASLLRAGGAVSSSIEPEVARIATQLDFTESGCQRLRAKRRKPNSVERLGEMIPPKSANSITRRSP